MANQPGLSPVYQALYDAQLPQLDLANQQANQARGMFYSGNAVDSQTKARADLLAKLLAQQATDTQQTAIQQGQINQAQSAQEATTKAANRNTNLNLIGSGVGAAATLAGLKYMQPGANGLKNMVAGGPTGYMQMQNGVMTPVPIAGGAAGTTGVGIGGAGLNPLGPTAMSVDPSGLGGLAGTTPQAAGVPPLFGPQGSLPPDAGLAGVRAPAGPLDALGQPAAALGAPAAQPAASMWNDPSMAAGGIGAGLAGGIGGYAAANAVNGGGKNTALASGLGGLAGAIGGGLMGGSGYGGILGAGLGALGGSFGGGLLGNLFK